jgi:dienelactone hydrolase
MKATLESVPRATGRDAADAARTSLRRALERSLGHKRLPWPPDLQARVALTVQKDGYHIENVVYQGLPGEWIPAQVYVPDRLPGRAPAILFYNGHWFPDSKSRPEFQAFCINMARLGFVVLNFETFGQGERGLSSRDHRRAEGLLVGVAQQGFAVYDTQVALHYLLTRRDVDPKRIGMTGASGGGFNTWMNAALDDRITVAVPVVGTCDLYEQAIARIPRDWDPSDHCHYIPGLFRYGNNHEFLAMSAPKPVLLISAADDRSFPIAGVREIAAYGRDLYKSYGMPDRFGYFEDGMEGHGYHIKKREAAYGWFLRWLMSKGDGTPVTEPPTETLPFDSPELRSFAPGRNQGSGRAMIAAVQRLTKASRRRPSAFDVTEVLGPWPKPIPWTAEIASGAIQRFEVPSEQDLDVPAVLVRPPIRPRGLLVTVDDRGKESSLSDTVVQQSLTNGWAVLAIDPRGIGELGSQRKTWLSAISLMQGENFVWRQTWDLLRAVQGVNAAPQLRASRVALYARGPNAALAAAYLIGYSGTSKDLSLSWFILRDGLTTFRDFVHRPKSLPLSYELRPDKDRNRPYDREIPSIFFPFDALRHFDVPELLASPGVPGLVVNAIDGDWDRKPAALLRKLLPRKIQILTDGDADARVVLFAETQQQK